MLLTNFSPIKLPVSSGLLTLIWAADQLLYGFLLMYQQIAWKKVIDNIFTNNF